MPTGMPIITIRKREYYCIRLVYTIVALYHLNDGRSNRRRITSKCMHICVVCVNVLCVNLGMFTVWMYFVPKPLSPWTVKSNAITLNPKGLIPGDVLQSSEHWEIIIPTMLWKFNKTRKVMYSLSVRMCTYASTCTITIRNTFNSGHRHPIRSKSNVLCAQLRKENDTIFNFCSSRDTSQSVS